MKEEKRKFWKKRRWKGGVEDAVMVMEECGRNEGRKGKTKRNLELR